ncbi:sensor histidine kinase [Actinoplanes subglobosus]|uniref:histidine kinase n=1 Tax=Actinoplanes subglobosus TaxID=1547892 RepID=A0ABV8JAA9_9ACTN
MDGVSVPARTATLPPEPDPFLRHPVGRWLLGRRDHIRRADRRRPWVLDSLVALAVLLFSLPQVVTGGRDGGIEATQPLGVRLAGAVLLLLPLWWRRRAPFAAFAAVAVTLLAQWTAGIWISTGVVMLVMLYGVAAHSTMRMLLWAAAITAAEFTAGLYLLLPVGENRLAVLLLLLGTCSAGIAAGLAARTSRAYLAALGDRAAWLEIDRDRQARLAVAAERARVAREMHDIVGHHVSIMIGLADGGATMAASRQETAAEPLRLIGETGRQALDELRRVLGVLREDVLREDVLREDVLREDVLREDGVQAPLSPQPGLAEVERMLAGVRAAGLTVSYRTSGDLQRLGPGLQLAIYRIVQEALTNTLKHAGAAAVAKVAVTVEGDGVRVRITDSGPAAGPGETGTGPAARPGETGTGPAGTHRGTSTGPAGGHGVVGIRERAGLYGGVVTAGPDGDGWTVDVVMTATTTRNP